MVLEITPIVELLAMYVWPFIRISAFVVALPAIGGAFVPRRVRAVFAIVLTIVIAPLVTHDLEAIEIFSLAGVIRAMQEVAMGLIMGFVVQVVFDAITLGAQTISMSMGLGFAVFIDRVTGVNIPVIGQLYLMLALLIFLAIDGHLALIQLLFDSFSTAPIGTAYLSVADAQAVLTWTSQLFVGAMHIALPAVTTLLIVNLSFGVMSRAAPTMNLFAVGFPISMLLGFVVLYLSVGSIEQTIGFLFPNALETLSGLMRVNP
ncbi:MAG: flagellar biosynthetic protein FliR [Pseudomonadota bacterium]